MYDFARGTVEQARRRRPQFNAGLDADGERITYGGGANGPNNLHWIRADGGGVAELLVQSAKNFEAGGWTPNGRELLYYEIPSDAVVVSKPGRSSGLGRDRQR